VLQPLDNGIIRSFKACYRKELLKRIIDLFELNEKTIHERTNFFKCINIRDAIIGVKKEWDKVIK
jgi:hypothetical protein